MIVDTLNSLKTVSNNNITINDVSQKILTKNWDFTDDFKFIYFNNFALSYFTNEDSNITLLDIARMFEESVISVEQPILSSQERDTTLGGRKFTNVKQYELFRFVVKFRDFEGGTLRRFFTKLWIAQQYKYPEEIESHIQININGVVLFSSTKCLISQISSQTFDNTNTGISEFDVTFVTPEFSDAEIKDFGTSSEYAKNMEELGF